MDAVFVESDPRLSFPDTGSALEDLRLKISQVATLFTEPGFGKPFVGLLAESQHDPALADALHQWLITARRAGAAEVLRRGVERGELRADLDTDVAHRRAVRGDLLPAAGQPPAAVGAVRAYRGGRGVCPTAGTRR